MHIDSLGNLMVMKGIASLQNTIITAMGILRHIPNYGHRELLVLYNSLSTCDPGDIYQTIAEAKAMKLRVNIICLSAELFICKKVAELTGGTFAVAIDSYHLAELLQQQTIPPPEIQANSTLVTDFIYMGFPKRVFQPHNCYGYDGKKVTVSTVAYQCPRCHTRTTDIPTQCCVCYLQLNSSSHIARSYHHLFPVPNYLEFQVRGVTSQLDILANKVDTLEDISHLHESNTSREASHTDNADNMDVESEAVKTEEITIPNKTRCFGCMVSFASHLLTTDSLIMQCGACKNYFCVECDLFVHDSLHNCPGCG